MKHFRTEHDPVTGVQRDYYWDAEKEEMTIRNRHQVGEILEANKRQANSTVDSRFGKEMLHHVADIPMGVVLQWKKEGLDIMQNDPETKRRLARKLNDPDWRYLKTTVKKV